MIDIESVNSLLQSGHPEQALRQFDGATGLSAQEYFLRGKTYWRLGRHREAMNDYHASADMDPEGPASKALEQAYAVMSFFNPDLLNP